MHILREQFYQWLYDPARNGLDLDHHPADVESVKDLVEDALWTAFQGGFDLQARCGAVARPAPVAIRCRLAPSGLACTADGTSECASNDRYA